MMTCLYVDDLLITNIHFSEIENLKDKIKSKFKMIDLDKIPYFLQMEFVKVKEDILMHHQRYVNDMLDVLQMIDCIIIINLS